MGRVQTLVVLVLVASVSFLGLTCIFSENVFASSWRTETVDSDGAVGRDTSIALDSNGLPHISYYDVTNKDLKYAHWDGDTWIVETVDSNGDVGEDTSMALDSNDRPHLSYYDITNQNLKYAKWTGSTWSIDTVDNSASVGKSSSIALDGNGHPHISYHDESQGDLKYAKWTGTTWNTETVDVLGGLYTSIEVDSDGHPHISYYADYRLWYARWNGTAWNIERVDFSNQVGRFTSLELDSNEYPHISYQDNVNFNLKYAKWTGSAWDIQTVSNSYRVGFYSSLALDSDDHPHISYHDDSVEHDLKYAEWTGSEWVIERVEWGGVNNVLGTDTSLELDNNGYPHISYCRISQMDLKYATKAPIEPSAPLNLNATAGNAYVELAWEPPASDGLLPITNYRIYRGTSSGQETFLVELPDVLLYNDTSLTNGQTYYYQVSAINAIGEGALSKEVNATPMTTPSPPTNLVQSHGDDYVHLTWQPPVSDGGSLITGYRIYKGTSPGTESLFSSAGPNLQYNDTDVASGVTYYYRVSAINQVGEGDLSDVVYATIPTVPRAPENLTASGGDSYIRLTWSPPTWDGGSPITSYTIYRGLSPDSVTPFASVGNNLSFNNTGTVNGVTYYYRVSASNRLGEGNLSLQKSAVPINEPPTCTFSYPSLHETVSGTVTIIGTASDPGGNVERVEIRISDDGWWIQVSGSTSWSYEWDTEGVSNGQHTIRARAFDGSIYSSEVSIVLTVSNPEEPLRGELWFWALSIAIGLIVIISVLVLIRRRSSIKQKVKNSNNRKGGEG